MAKGIVIGGLNGAQSNIKSIQRGSIASNSISSAGLAIAISSVDVTKAIVRVVFNNNSGPIDNKDLIRAEIISSTQIKLYNGNSSGTTGRTIYWEVIEFNNVKSLQKGTYACQTISNSIETTTVSTIDPLKSLVFDSFSSANNSGSYLFQSKGAVLSNSTTISFIKYDYIGASTHHWQLIEFN